MTEKKSPKEVATADKSNQLDLLENAKAGHGSQVIKILEDHSYELDEDELKKILLDEKYRDLPVVVVSVAGTYRGGKSFLLNILLRYLTSAPSAQQDGSWLAEDSKPLTGFSWRGGSVRNTTGILLWSVPIVITLPSGDKVAVLLMDTQGTFDNESTVRDCSTIFGISTLLSSVQIYNLSMNIKEDDLQHLQLFTEYGKLARDEGTTKPFQSLVFLVRDWPYPWEFPYGAEGGKSLLQNKLQVTEKTPQEIKELREHLQSSFDNISAFLLPHPGFSIMNPKFNGAVKELLPDFRTYLVKLVASLFSPDKLSIKSMNAEKMKLGDLFVYFKTYMTLFNSEEVPKPTNIIQATVTAVLMNAKNEAREKYTKGMDNECGSTQISVPEDDLKDLHRKYIATARDTFIAKKKMGSPEVANKYLEELGKELDAQLPKIEMNNTAKLEATLKKAVDVYEKSIQNVSKGRELCLHPQDFQELHKEGVKTAMKMFDANRKIISSKNDFERSKLEQSFEKHYESLKKNNDLSNKTAVKEICSQYSRFMESKCSLEPPMREDAFRKEHEKALKLAQENFIIKRNRSHSYSEDVYKHNMIAEINSIFIQLNVMNTSKYNAMATTMMRQAVNKSRQLYQKEMKSECGETLHSMPNEDVEFLHRKNLENAKLSFVASVTMGTKEESNLYLQELIKELDGELPLYQQINKSKLQTNIEKSEDAYHAEFDNISKNQPLCLHPNELEKIHQKSFETAMRLFETNRKIISSKTDEERSKMEQNLKKSFEELQWVNDKNNENLVKELYLEYSKFMNVKCNVDPPLREDAFKHGHETALKTALDDFRSRRNKQSMYPLDTYKTSLETDINALFNMFDNINKSRIRTMVFVEIANASDKTRQFYEKSMMEECGADQVSMMDEDLEDLHKKYLDKAKNTFNSHIKLATEKETSKHLEEIIQELEGRRLMFQQFNTLKYNNTVKNALAKFEETVMKLNDGKTIRVHSEDIKKINDECFTTAMKVFKTNRKIISSKPDKGENDLILLLKKRQENLTTINEQNNMKVIKEIHNDYWQKMKIHCAHIPTYSDEEFNKLHEVAITDAHKSFISTRSNSNPSSQDVYSVILVLKMNESYKDFKKINSGNRQEKENIKADKLRLQQQNEELKSLQKGAKDLQNLVNRVRQKNREEKAETERQLQNWRNYIYEKTVDHMQEIEKSRQRFNKMMTEKNNTVSKLTNRINDLVWRINNGAY